MNFSLFQSILPEFGCPAKRCDHRSRHGQWIRTLILEVIFVLELALKAQSATYYVDYSSGSDSANGTTTSTAWQHCPGDYAATSTPASTTLAAGDIVNFKGGVVYYDNGFTNRGTFPSTIYVTSSGTSGNPITFQTAPSWGTGRAVFDGIVSGWTNVMGFNIEGNYIVLNDLEIKDDLNSGVFAYYGGAWLTIENCSIHHIGTFPDAGLDIGTAYTITWNDVNVVSNTFYDCINSTCSTGASNYIFYANEVYNMSQHGMQPCGKGGYLLIANNYFHDNTNTTFGAHCDAIQIFPGSVFGGRNTVIVADNKFYNNADDLRFQYDAGTNMAGIYVLNNVFWSANLGQSCTIGSALTITNIFFVNNTWLNKNSGPGAFTFGNNGYTSVVFTNVYSFNNLFYNSAASEIPNEPWFRALHNGYNLWPAGNCLAVATNNANLYSLAVYQATWPTHEVNSTINAVTFVDYANMNFQLAAGSGGIGQGTNMSNLLPSSSFNYLPAAYMVDPTKDINGNQRGSSWDIGAYQYSTNTLAVVQIAPPIGLSVIVP
jgi:hypothetical protein